MKIPKLTFSKLEYFKKIVKESILVIILTSIIGFLTGIVLSDNEDILYYFPIILIILPSLNDTVGDLSTVFISRLTTNLFLGVIEPKISKSKSLKDEFISLLIVLLLCTITILFFGFLISVFGGIDLVNPFLIIIIIFLSVFLIFISLFILLFVSAILLFKRGYEPNNFLIPIATTGADFLTPFFIILFILLIL